MKTKVFISWSGNPSKRVALALKEMIEIILPAVEAWVSDSDIELGTRWYTEIVSELENCAFGIICLNRENQLRPWVNFEAGALSKHVDKSRVIPYTTGMRPADIAQGPMAMFQAIESTEVETLKLLQSINQLTSDARPESKVTLLFDKFWPGLNEVLESVADDFSSRVPQKEKNPTELNTELLEKVNEVLENTRALMRNDVMRDITPTQIEMSPWEFIKKSSQEHQENVAFLEQLRQTVIRRASITMRSFLKGALWGIDSDKIVLTMEDEFKGEQLMSKYEELKELIKESLLVVDVYHPFKRFQLLVPSKSKLGSIE